MSRLPRKCGCEPLPFNLCVNCDGVRKGKLFAHLERSTKSVVNEDRE